MAEDIDDERRAEKKREAMERRKEMERERRKAIRAAYARQREAKKKKVGILSAVRKFWTSDLQDIYIYIRQRWEKPLRDGVERIWALPSAQVPTLN